ncbi:MAG: hypothetical protein BWY76_03373 [bacterium ADurb.Bin429]|nr:MAG: hypothetical protein BWY76_03373 [bacterium ADurb.Bin429]
MPTDLFSAIVKPLQRHEGVHAEVLPRFAEAFAAEADGKEVCHARRYRDGTRAQRCAAGIGQRQFQRLLADEDDFGINGSHDWFGGGDLPVFGLSGVIRHFKAGIEHQVIAEGLRNHQAESCEREETTYKEAEHRHSPQYWKTTSL